MLGSPRILGLVAIAAFAVSCGAGPSPVAPVVIDPIPTPRALLDVTVEGGPVAVRDASSVIIRVASDSAVGLSYKIDYGDGTSDSRQSWGGEPVSLTHRFPNVGTAHVVLTVTNPAAKTGTASADVVVKDITGRWTNAIHNSTNGRDETRFLQLTQGASNTVTGTYTHPEGNSESLSGSIFFQRGMDLLVVSRTIEFYADGEDSHFTDGISGDLSALKLHVKGGSADGMLLTFTRLQ